MSQNIETQMSRRNRRQHSIEQQRRSDVTNALVSNLKIALDIADEVLSAAPIPGVAYALPILKSLAERISQMRANTRDKEDVIARIRTLINLLVSSAKEVTTQIEALAPDERERVETDTRQSLVLKGRIQAFIDQLNRILASAESTRHERWYQRVWFAGPDAECLKALGQRIEQAKENFNLEGAIEIRRHVGEMVQNAREIRGQLKIQVEMQQKMSQREEDKATQEILDGLKPANACHTSVLFEEKSRLQPGTRKKLLRDLAQWAGDSDSGERIYVLFGQAGMGKSSIAHAFCQQLPDHHLGASFFFLRSSGECSDVHRVFPTISYQLAESIPSLRPHIANAARKHQAGRDQALEHQLRTLIINPLKGLADSATPPTLIFTLDGVDECMNTPDTIVPSMLQMLCQAANEIPFLRILIATRPETYILGALRSSEHSDIIHWRNLQKEENVGSDIRLFIETELMKGAKAGGFQLLTDRPDAIEKLTKLSDGLFIWASTAVRFLLQDKHLAGIIFDALLASRGAEASSGIYDRLDGLYMIILNNAFDRFRKDVVRMRRIRQVLAWFATAPMHPLQAAVDIHAENLAVAGIPPNITMDVIDRLRSVLNVDGDIAPATIIRACHASFPQFLVDGARCGDSAFLVDTGTAHALIAMSLLDLLVRDEVDSLLDAQGNMPPMWDYARNEWTGHIRAAQYTPELGRSLWGFVKTHFDDWLRKKGAWCSQQDVLDIMDRSVAVCSWYEDSGQKDGLVTVLDELIDRRSQELAAEAAQFPEGFNDSELLQIMRWTTNRRAYSTLIDKLN